MSLLAVGILMGLGGTIAMDIWSVVLLRVTGNGWPNWVNPGRWFGHVFRGKLFHDDINAAEKIPQEHMLGWVLHYGVGVLYGVIWAVIAGSAWLAAPTFVPVWIFALITIAAGWFLLQPGMGLGWGGSKTPTPWKGRFLGLVAHSWFGLGMWIAALIAA